LRNARDVHARQLGQRLLHHALRHADSQRAGQQLVEQQARIEGERAPGIDNDGAAHMRLAAGDGQQVLLDPVGQRMRGVGLGRIVEQQRQRLGEVADVGVARIHQPVGIAAFLRDPVAQFARIGDAIRTACEAPA
jgi:hypothetical protein